MLSVYTDGASRGNPGKAASGYIIYKDQKEFCRDFRYIGFATNNEAEYKAIIMALEKAKDVDGEVKIFSDSELVIKQLTGQYKVREPRLKDLYDMAKDVEKAFSKISYTHLHREDRIISEVDAGLNKLLDII
jgi:ribonuclease HI